MDDEPLPPELQRAAEAYHRPPETPREEMWARIQMRREAERGSEDDGVAARRFGAPAHWWRLAGGIAALLAIGVGIGRISVGPSTPTSPPAAPLAVTRGPAATAPGGTAFQIVALEHLGQAESFLTLFRASIRQGARDTLSSRGARQLLANNRLLLDSPASGDPRVRLLLEDLELVLAGIAQLAPGRDGDELDLVTEGLERSGMLVRLRAAVPAGDAPLSDFGAL